MRTAMRGGVDATTPKLLCLGVLEVPVVALVENTVGEGGARANGEDVTLQPRAIGVDVEERGALRGSGRVSVAGCSWLSGLSRPAEA